VGLIPDDQHLSRNHLFNCHRFLTWNPARADDENRTRQVFVGNEVLHLGDSSAFLEIVSIRAFCLPQEMFSFFFFELLPRIELELPVYETGVLPLNYGSSADDL
jgi:hypothetical protein